MAGLVPSSYSQPAEKIQPPPASPPPPPPSLPPLPATRSCPALLSNCMKHATHPALFPDQTPNKPAFDYVTFLLHNPKKTVPHLTRSPAFPPPSDPGRCCVSGASGDVGLCEIAAVLPVPAPGRGRTLALREIKPVRFLCAVLVLVPVLLYAAVSCRPTRLREGTLLFSLGGLTWSVARDGGVKA